ncbi:hypothetical protein S83_016251, partial [Arachis hypogaea]
GGEPHVADFIHRKDRLGNIFLPPPMTKKIEKSACEFLVEKVSKYLGEAIKRDSSFANKVNRMVILGGSFFALGNVNPNKQISIHGKIFIRVGLPLTFDKLDDSTHK